MKNARLIKARDKILNFSWNLIVKSFKTIGYTLMFPSLTAYYIFGNKPFIQGSVDLMDEAMDETMSEKVIYLWFSVMIWFVLISWVIR